MKRYSAFRKSSFQFAYGGTLRIERIRPVMITVGATILALFPLALEGGPLWKPLCYAQIGGLAVATFITLLLVPVFYAIFVLDLKWITWDTTARER
jgi:multidrug efflux pump